MDFQSRIYPINLEKYGLLRGDLQWLFQEDLQKLMAVLNQGQDKALIVGGAVRNCLLHEKIEDVDIATTTLPEETASYAKSLNYKILEDGKKFGTIRVLTKGQAFEVTSLRQDVETDGRHAKVKFGRDWHQDAKRRDFTINAFYMDKDGNIYDPLENILDIKDVKICFIDDPAKRIQEDYLRILRFFRFFAYYGKGRPDSQALISIAKYKEGLKTISGERIWSELKKLLTSKDPMRSLRWMRQSGVLTCLIEETEKWGIDELASLIKMEKKAQWQTDPLLRLQAIIPPRIEVVTALAKRLKLSHSEKRQLENWALLPSFGKYSDEKNFKHYLYFQDREAVIAHLKLRTAIVENSLHYDMCEREYYNKLLSIALSWHKPDFPIKGQDLLDKGYEKGQKLGQKLRALEQIWCQSDFTLDKDSLLKL